MNRIVLNEIPLKFNYEEILKANRIRQGTGFEETFLQALRTAEEKLHCRAILKWANVGKIEADNVSIDNTTFKSKVMADNLKDKERVFLYILIVGDEIDKENLIEEAVLKDIIKGVALDAGRKYLEEYLTTNFGFQDISYMNPGSLPDWPIKNNVPLFEMIENIEEIGAKINTHHYIIPWNASSGIIFENGNGYSNCALCKNKCEKRRVPFNQEDYNRIFV